MSPVHGSALERRALTLAARSQRAELRRILPIVAAIAAVASAVSIPGLALEPGAPRSAEDVSALLPLAGYLGIIVICRRGPVRHPERLFALLGWLGVAAATFSSGFDTVGGDLSAMTLVIIPVAVALFGRWSPRFQAGWCVVAGLMVTLVSIGANALVADRSHLGVALIAGLMMSAVLSLEGARALHGSVSRAARREVDLRDSRQESIRARAASAVSERRYREIVETAAEGIWVGDTGWRTVFVNEPFSRMVGASGPEALAGVPARDLVHPDDLRAVWGAVAPDTDNVRAVGDFRLRQWDGVTTWVTATASPIVGPDGTTGHLVMLTDIGGRRAAEAELRSVNAILRGLVDRDGLTGLLNRRSLDRDMGAIAVDSQAVGVLVIDVDHFKDFNDRFGHQAGDDALRAIARVLTVGVRDDDRVYRYGGEEFLVVLPGANQAVVAMVGERLRTRIALAHDRATDEDWRLPTISIGGAWRNPAQDRDIDAVILAADRALYQAKRAGRDRLVLDGDVGLDRTPMAGDAPAQSPTRRAAPRSGGVGTARSHSSADG